MTQPTDDRPQPLGLTKKYGPLPGWAWVGVATVAGVVVLMWYRNRQAAAAAAAGGTGTTGTAGTVSVQGADAATVSNLQDQLATVVSQIRDLQGGTSTPLPNTPGSNNPAPTPAVPTQSVIVTDGTDVQAFLDKYKTNLQTLLSLNPNLSGTLREANTYGYITATNQQGPRHTVFNVGSQPIPVSVPGS